LQRGGHYAKEKKGEGGVGLKGDGHDFTCRFKEFV